MLHSSKRAKANAFEEDVAYSLRNVFPGISTTQRTGMVQGYDLSTPDRFTVIECKRHKRFTWNEFVKDHKLLTERTPNSQLRYVVVQGNRQPVLVYGNMMGKGFAVMQFQDFFNVFFEKRPKGYTKGEMK